MSKLLLVDCDGTIRETISGKPFIDTPLYQKIIEGANTALSWYQDKGWEIVGLSNQGGVAANHKSLADAEMEQRITLDIFPQIQCTFICPDFKGNECWWIQRDRPAVDYKDQSDLFLNGNLNGKKRKGSLKGSFRKPNPGMIIYAIGMFGGSEEQGDYWYVGDREEDRLAATAAGVNFCDAAVWRNRFKAGIHEVDATPELIEFLEGIKLQP